MSGETKSVVRLSDVLKATLVRPIAFYVPLARLCRSALAGLMLSQALYWTEVQARTNPKADGWFFKTREEWGIETHLSRWEQQTARAILRTFDFWQEQRRGVPAQMYFRVDMRKLALAIAHMVVTPPAGLRKQTSGPTDHLQKGGYTSAQQVAIPPTFLTETTTEITSEITAGESAAASAAPPAQPANSFSENWDECLWSETEQDWVCEIPAALRSEQRITNGASE